MNWHAIVPLKAAGRRKTRLAGILDAAERDRLSETMLAHVLAVLRECGVAATVLDDDGTGLNAQLIAARDPARPTLVLFADLPLLRAVDVEAMLAGPAVLAPDRAGVGTNAIAIRDGRPFDYRFGPGSLARHRAAAPDAAIVTRTGLACDIDTPKDLAAWGGWDP